MFPLATAGEYIPVRRPSRETLFSTPRVLDDDAQSIIIHSSFSIDRTGFNPYPVFWTGHICSFPTLRERWDQICRTIYSKQFQGIDDGFYDAESPSPLYVQLDRVDELQDAPSNDAGHIDVIAWLEQKFPNDQLQVLLLGFCLALRTKVRYEDVMYGLLLVRHEEQWARVGVCQWSSQFDWTSPYLALGDDDKDTLRGRGESWIEQRGIFGYVD